ncbi:hypothetical protein RRG08_066435 [Elysia crispata]|uniref:Beta-1,4-galactosyltransferase n=1 Tax=Elysia crispata TaxID=231223 RepID=A0AAE0Z929_9GAST|nr:hypothetical protein RRG08_066435 [Elysia crispata]
METRIKSKPAALLRSPQSLRLPLHLSKAAGIRKQGGSAHQYVRGKNVAKVMDTKPTTSRNRSLHLDRLYRLAVKEQEWKSFMFTTNCSVVPLNYFEGRMKVRKDFVAEPELTQRFLTMKDGHNSPKNCKATEKLAIIIPFRNRYRHLFILLPNLIPMLIKQGLNFTIFLIEQDLPTSFNKGVIYNAGFLEALKVDNFDCFIFHDVDMLPLNDLNMYRCDPRGPLHFVAGVNKFQYGLMYYWLIGGVLGFTTDQYRKVNGFSNLYFGWGAEDDDMRLRILSTHMSVYRRPKTVGLYDMILHSRDKRWKPNKARFHITKMASNRTLKDGINSVKYTLTGMVKKPLFIHIRIYVSMSDIYNTAPHFMKKILEVAKQEDYKNRVKDGTAGEINHSSK